MRHVLIIRVTILRRFTLPGRTSRMDYEIGNQESVSVAVIRAVSAMTVRRPESLIPLAHTIDPDALDGLFTNCSDGPGRTQARLSFTYNDCCVTVRHGERLSIRQL